MKLFIIGSLISMALSTVAYASPSDGYASNSTSNLVEYYALDSDATADTDMPTEVPENFAGGRGHGGGGHVGGGVHRGGIHGGRWHPHPGWHAGWHWNRGWHPRWWRIGIVFPLFYWAVNVPIGYYQCIAFNEGLNPYTSYGPDINQAAYGALYACGGPNYAAMGCYIPTNYCQLR